MKHAQNLDGITSNSVHDDVWQPGDHQFPRACKLACPPRLREIHQAEHGGPDPAPHVGGCARVVSRDEGNVEPE
jgi:hypothetical protein